MARFGPCALVLSLAGVGLCPYEVIGPAGPVELPICGGTLPLNPDLLWVQSLSAPAVFANWGGVLDADGVSAAPQLHLPSDPVFLGYELHVAAVTLDPSQPCRVRSISAAERVGIH